MSPAELEAAGLTSGQAKALDHYRVNYFIQAAFGVDEKGADRYLWARWLVQTGRLHDHEEPCRE